MRACYILRTSGAAHVPVSICGNKFDTAASTAAAATATASATTAGAATITLLLLALLLHDVLQADVAVAAEEL